ncbi:phosphatidylserine decarboxylase 1 [Orobanche gracilis]
MPNTRSTTRMVWKNRMAAMEKRNEKLADKVGNLLDKMYNIAALLAKVARSGGLRAAEVAPPLSVLETATLRTDLVAGIVKVSRAISRRESSHRASRTLWQRRGRVMSCCRVRRFRPRRMEGQNGAILLSPQYIRARERQRRARAEELRVTGLSCAIEEARSKGVELEFHPDVKARFLRLLPLRSISRFWGSLTRMELPIWLRPFVYKAWARAFHSNLEEAQLPLEEYASLREFFVRMLREGVRPINSDPYCLVTGSKILGPVDGTILRFGELRGPGAMIEQVKGCSYRASSLLGANSHLPVIAAGDAYEESDVEENNVRDVTQKSWWKISFASPKVGDTASSRPLKGLFYCVIYLKPGDYHRIHSPVDWNILVRRHFTAVVLEGQWQEGYMAIAAIGATNIGSIELSIEPALMTNNPQKKLLHSEPPEERVYEPQGTGVLIKKGDELAAFNMGSTVLYQEG